LVYIYGSYRKNKIGVPFFLDHPVRYANHFNQFLGFGAGTLIPQ